MKLYLVGPGHPFAAYEEEKVDNKHISYAGVARGYTQHLVTYTDSDRQYLTVTKKSSADQSEEKDRMWFRIPPTEYYINDGAHIASIIEYHNRDVLVITTEELAEVLEKHKV